MLVCVNQYTRATTPRATHLPSAMRRAQDTLRQLAALGVILLGAAAVAWLAARGWQKAPDPVSDFYDFFWAAKAVRDGTDISTSGEAGYLYPPLLATCMVPLTHLSAPLAARAWMLSMIALGIASAALSARGASRTMGGIRTTFVWSCAATGFLLLADNFRAEAEWANCNNLIILLIAGAFACARNRPAWCGALLGAAAALKYTPLIFLAYFLVRRRWKEAAWMTATLTLLTLAPALALGWDANLTALANASGGIASMLGTAPLDHANPSFNPLEASFSWSIPSGMARAALHLQQSVAPWVIAGTAGSVLGLATTTFIAYRRAGLAFWSRSPRADDATHPLLVLAELTATLALMVAISPQTTKRHFNYLLPMTVLLVVLVVMRKGTPRWTAALALAIMWFLAAPMADIDAIRPFMDHTWKDIGGPGFAVVAAAALLLAAAASEARKPVPQPGLQAAALPE